MDVKCYFCKNVITYCVFSVQIASFFYDRKYQLYTTGDSGEQMAM